MANQINVKIKIEKIANGYLLRGTPIREIHEGNENAIQVDTLADVHATGSAVFDNELQKLD